MKRSVIILFAFVLSVFFAMAQKEIPFNGVIKNLAGEPIRNAKVYVIDGFSSRSDKNGKFGLTNVHPDDTIKVFYKKILYHIPVEGKKSITIVLGNEEGRQANAFDAPELADLGFGYVKRRESNTASSGISGEVLRRTGYSSVIQALQGKVAGLNISGNSVTIRGISSINSGTEPLYILDGAEVPNFDNVSVWDVETVEVVKDGSLYGVRGANGVIIVRTLRGK